MIKQEFYIERKDGTNEIYSEAINVENSGYAYTKTDIPIDKEINI